MERLTHTRVIFANTKPQKMKCVYIIMGIERFFNSIRKNEITNMHDQFTNKLEKQIDTTHFYIDFNSIIYIVSNKVIFDLNRIIYAHITSSINPKISTLAKIYNIDTSKPISPQINIEAIIINKVKRYVINMAIGYVKPESLKTIFIAIDGVPDKAKILEQKHRRYIGGMIITGIKQKIFQKYEQELKQSNRYQYETQKISWSRNNISPGTAFMDKLCNTIKNIDFKKYCPNLSSYIFTGVYDPGEGESKIMNHIRQTKNISNVVIYSPDNDLTPLGMILHVPNLIILKHNQQDDNYDLIHIDILSNNLFKYIQSKLSKQINKTNAINDIVFIFSIFGNDFLPKIQSLNVKYDFNVIIDKYVDFIKQSDHIIQSNSINQKALLKLIQILYQDEAKNIMNNYMSSNYENYEKLKKIMQATTDNFTDILQKFLTTMHTLNTSIKNKTTYIPPSDFTTKLMKLTVMENKQYTNPTEFLTDYKSYYDKHHKFPIVKISFIKYKRTINTGRNIEKLNNIHNNIDPNMKLLAYDKEIFKFDNMLDEYSTKFNAFPMNLGYVTIRDGVFISENIEDSIKKYYKTFFHIDDLNGKTMKDMLNNYIEGLLWVFKYYYYEIDLTRANIWYYKYHFAPLLNQLYQFLKHQPDNYIEDLLNNLDKYKIDRSQFFTPVEHLLYTSPVQLNDELVPDKYKSIIKDRSLFPDLESIINKIWTSNTSDEIDCKGALFITKCNLKVLDRYDAAYDNAFIKKIRSL